MTIPLGRSGSSRSKARTHDTSDIQARLKTSSSSKNVTPRDSIDILKHSYSHRPSSPAILGTPEARSTTMKRSRSFRRGKASNQPDVIDRHQDSLMQNKPPWKMSSKDEPHSAMASIWMDKRFPGHSTRPPWDESPRMRPNFGQNGIEEPRSAVSRAASYPDTGRKVEAGAKNGRWNPFGGLFTKKSTPSPESSPSIPALVSPLFEVHIEGGTAKRPFRAATEGSRGLFRSRSKRDPVKNNYKRANRVSIRTTDISNPIRIIDEDHSQCPLSGGRNSTKPVLDVEIPSVKLERYSVMFGSLLEDHSSTPSLLARRQKNLDRLKPIDIGHENNIGRCQSKLDPLKASNTVKSPLTTSHLCQSTHPREHDSASQSKPDSNPSIRPPSHHRSLTASNLISSPKPPNTPTQHVVVMVHRPRRTSSLKVKQIPTEPYKSPRISPSNNHDSRTAPPSPLERAEDIGSSEHQHTQASTESYPDAKAEISIARQVSISRQRQHIQYLPPPVGSRAERFVDGSRALTPRVVQMQRGQSRRRSQTGLLDVA